MGRKPKLFLPLVVGFLDDDRIAVAGDGPTLLYVAMCLKAKALGSDGRLSEVQIKRLNRSKWRVELATLAELGLVLWDDAAGNWFVSAWFSHNDAISQIEEKRAADRVRKRGVNSARNPDGIRAESDRNPPERVSDSLLSREKGSREKRSEVPALRVVRDWCGYCHKDTRMHIDGEDRSAPCPKCHPNREAS